MGFRPIEFGTIYPQQDQDSGRAIRSAATCSPMASEATDRLGPGYPGTTDLVARADQVPSLVIATRVARRDAARGNRRGRNLSREAA